jgi:hypothetical protein
MRATRSDMKKAAVSSGGLFHEDDRTGLPHSRNEGAKSLQRGGRSDRGVNMRLRLMIVNIRHPRDAS